MAANRSSRGFTLVELLVVVTILGVLTAVAVFAVQGSTDSASSSSCAADASALEQAEEAHKAATHSYASEAALVAAGRIRSESTLHDIELGGGSYTLVGIGDCASEAEADD
jgi:prepilin-type N-terminal cleavage/methylation domain-containing protein